MLFSTNAILLAGATVASAMEFKVDVHSGKRCGGNTLTGAINHITKHCFMRGGNSWNHMHLTSDTNPSNCAITTWSGNNCKGSNSQWNDLVTHGKHNEHRDPNSCIDVPFGSFELGCCHALGCDPKRDLEGQQMTYMNWNGTGWDEVDAAVAAEKFS